MSIWTRFLGGSSAVEHRTLIPTVGGLNPPLPSISRRSFLAGAVAAPLVVRSFFGPPKGGWPVGDFNTTEMRYRAVERYSVGSTDPRALYGSVLETKERLSSNVLNNSFSRFREVLEPGLRKFWEEGYQERPGEWEQIFGDGIALNSTPHPGSELITEEDRLLAESGGWKCVNGHPYCNRCTGGPTLTEESLEQVCIEIQKGNRRWFRA